MATYVKNQLYMVPLAELQPDPRQPRKFMDPVAMTSLKETLEPAITRAVKNKKKLA